MNDCIKYDECFSIELDNNLYTKYVFPKENQKTITISNGLFKATIKVKDIKINPKSYWEIGGYDHQFGGRDANCWLCGWYGMDYDECKCKNYYTLEEHKENVKIARRNYLKTLFKNYFKDKVKLINELSDEQINNLLFDDSNNIRKIRLHFPSPYDYNNEIKKMSEYLNNIL